MTDETKTALLSKLRAPVADEREMSLAVALHFADFPRPYHTLEAPADTNGELYRALAVLAREYRAALASAPVAGEAQGVSVERLAKDPFLAAQLWRNPVDRAPVAGEAQSPIGYVDPVYVAGRQCGMKWNAKIYDAPNQEATAPLYAAPQASEAVRPSIPPAKPLPDLMMAAYHEAIGWNACRAAMLQSAPQADKDGGDCAKGAGDDADIPASVFWPKKPTPAMLDALRTGSRKDWPSDELCRVRYAALRSAALSTPSVVKQSLTATQTGEKGEKDAQ